MASSFPPPREDYHRNVALLETLALPESIALFLDDLRTEYQLRHSHATAMARDGYASQPFASASATRTSRPPCATPSRAMPRLTLNYAIDNARSSARATHA